MMCAVWISVFWCDCSSAGSMLCVFFLERFEELFIDACRSMCCTSLALSLARSLISASQIHDAVRFSPPHLTPFFSSLPLIPAFLFICCVLFLSLVRPHLPLPLHGSFGCFFFSALCTTTYLSHTLSLSLSLFITCSCSPPLSLSLYAFSLTPILSVFLWISACELLMVVGWQWLRETLGITALMKGKPVSRLSPVVSCYDCMCFTHVNIHVWLCGALWWKHCSVCLNILIQQKFCLNQWCVWGSVLKHFCNSILWSLWC